MNSILSTLQALMKKDNQCIVELTSVSELIVFSFD